MSEKVLASDSHDTKVRKQAPFTVEMSSRHLNAIAEALHVAKREIDNMHHKDREVHTFNRSEIREIESNLREKVNFRTDQSHVEIELTANEVLALEEGVTSIQFSDTMEMSTSQHYLSATLSMATDPRS